MQLEQLVEVQPAHPEEELVTVLPPDEKPNTEGTLRTSGLSQAGQCGGSDELNISFSNLSLHCSQMNSKIGILPYPIRFERANLIT